MPTTAGTTWPIAPYAPAGDASVATMEFISTDATIAKGDVVILTSGKLVEDNSAAVGDTVIGVALHASTAANDQVVVALALPGQLFTGNLITTGPGDIASGAIGSHCGLRVGILESTQGHGCLDFAVNTGANACAATLGFAGQQKGVAKGANPWDATVAAINPRMIFAFVISFFNIES